MVSGVQLQCLRFRYKGGPALKKDTMVVSKIVVWCSIKGVDEDDGVVGGGGEEDRTVLDPCSGVWRI